jgi:hypothetical protein
MWLSRISVHPSELSHKGMIVQDWHLIWNTISSLFRIMCRPITIIWPNHNMQCVLRCLQTGNKLIFWRDLTNKICSKKCNKSYSILNVNPVCTTVERPNSRYHKNQDYWTFRKYCCIYMERQWQRITQSFVPISRVLNH